MDGQVVSGDRSISQAALMGNAARAAGGFDRLGVGANDTVAMMLRNDFAFFEGAFGAALIGAYATPINWHYKADEAGYIVEDSDAKVLLVHADLLPQVAGGIPAHVHVFVVKTPPEIRDAYGLDDAACAVPAGRTDWDEWVAQQPAWDRPAPALRTNIIYTSGTTGRPKGVRREPATPEMAAKIEEMVSVIFDVRPGEERRTVVTGPVYHSAPNLYALMNVRDGGLTILQPRFDPEDLLAMIERHRITHLHMVPTMFVRLLKLPAEVRARYDLSSLRFVVHAAAPCAPEVKRQMIEWWGPVINEYYGGTETGGAVFHTAEEALRKPGTVGRPIPGAVVRIYDDEGRVLPPGKVGEIFLRIGDWPDFTYHKKDEMRRECERDGLITCGDVGWLDEDGFLFISDRKKDMVISGGVNIYPAEIESVLIAMPGVADCGVFGIPDEEFGEALCAFVQPQPGAALDAAQVRAWLRQRIAGYKVPKQVEFRSELPREDSGKIFKRKLREPYWAQAGRAI